MKPFPHAECHSACSKDGQNAVNPTCGAPEPVLETCSDDSLMASLSQRAPYAAEHVLGIASGVAPEVLSGLNRGFFAASERAGVHLAMARAAEREGYPEIAQALTRYALEEANYAAQFAELTGRAVTDSTKRNLERCTEAKFTACADWAKLAALAKSQNLDAIHDAVHEMARDEARHGKCLEGLLRRYFT